MNVVSFLAPAYAAGPRPVQDSTPPWVPDSRPIHGPDSSWTALGRPRGVAPLWKVMRGTEPRDRGIEQKTTSSGSGSQRGPRILAWPLRHLVPT